jgi:tetratricopeptide (TPR) repeat protein
MLGDDHPDTLESKNDLAVLYKKQGDYSKAEPLLLEALENHRFKLSDIHSYAIESLSNLIDLCKARDKPEKAKELRAQLKQIEDFEE